MLDSKIPQTNKLVSLYHEISVAYTFISFFEIRLPLPMSAHAIKQGGM